MERPDRMKIWPKLPRKAKNINPQAKIQKMMMNPYRLGI